MVSYSKDSPEDNTVASKAIEDSYTSHPAIDKENRPKFPKNLDLNDHYFKSDREFLNDILAIVRNGVVDYFRIIRWIFHDIKDLSLKNRAITSKLDQMEAKRLSQNTVEVLWVVEEKREMAKCIQRI